MKITFQRTPVSVPAIMYLSGFTSSLNVDVNRAGDFVFLTRDIQGLSVHFPHRGTILRVPFVATTYPMIRWVGGSQALLFDGARRQGDNAWLIDDSGTTKLSFAIGDAVENVVANGKYIIVTHYDEGVFGDDPLAKNGIAVFESSGAFLWGWNASPLVERLMVYDCYAAGLTDDGATLGAFLYSNYANGPSYAFTLLDIEGRVAALHAVPDDDLQRPHSLSAGQDGQWLFASGPLDAQNVIAWRPGDKTYTTAPSPVYLTRGLGGSRFLSITDKSVEVVTVTLHHEE